MGTPRPGQSRLSIVPCSLEQANLFVAKHHRHHEPLHTHKFSLAVVDEDGALRGVAICQRPASRMLDNGWTLEVVRLATDGCPNACSALYGASWRAGRAMGYRRCITYILEEETGVSLKAAGWRCTLAAAGGGSWSRISRPREDKAPLGLKARWEVGEVGPFPDFPNLSALVDDGGQLRLELEVAG